MECWAHAAARRRQLSNGISLVSNSSSRSTSSSRQSSSTASASPISSVSLESSVVDDMIRRTVPPARMPHVCVVGAGMAGLKAADVLTKKGIKVTMFEGRDRVGGRVGQFEPLIKWRELSEDRFIKVLILSTLQICKPIFNPDRNHSLMRVVAPIGSMAPWATLSLSWQKRPTPPTSNLPSTSQPGSMMRKANPWTATYRKNKRAWSGRLLRKRTSTAETTQSQYPRIDPSSTSSRCGSRSRILTKLLLSRCFKSQEYGEMLLVNLSRDKV